MKTKPIRLDHNLAGLEAQRLFTDDSKSTATLKDLRAAKVARKVQLKSALTVVWEAFESGATVNGFATRKEWAKEFAKVTPRTCENIIYGRAERKANHGSSPKELLKQLLDVINIQGVWDQKKDASWEDRLTVFYEAVTEKAADVADTIGRKFDRPKKKKTAPKEKTKAGIVFTPKGMKFSLDGKTHVLGMQWAGHSDPTLNGEVVEKPTACGRNGNTSAIVQSNPTCKACQKALQEKPAKKLRKFEPCPECGLKASVVAGKYGKHVGNNNQYPCPASDTEVQPQVTLAVTENCPTEETV